MTEANASPQHLFVLDSSALVGYMNTLRPRPPIHCGNPEETLETHKNILGLWNNLQQKQPDSAIRIPDYVVYELTGLLPNSLKFMRQRFEAINASYATETEKAIQRHQLITVLTDSSVRADSRGMIYGKSYGERRDEIYHLFTLMAYHPHSIQPTKVGEEFCRRAKVESAVVAGVSGIQPQAPESLAALGDYTLSFSDVLTDNDFAKAFPDLRIHWGQMYFMGLVDEDSYKARIDGAAAEGLSAKQMKRDEKAGDGHDINRRFVTFKAIGDQRKAGELEPSGIVAYADEAAQAYAEQEQAVRTAKSALEEAKKALRKGPESPALKGKVTKAENALNAAESAVIAAPKNFHFRDIEKAISHAHPTAVDSVGQVHLPARMNKGWKKFEGGPTIAQAVGPAKICFDQLIFGGILPGSSMKKGKDSNAQDIKSLGIMASALGYHLPKETVDPSALRESLKLQGFFERTASVADLLKVQQALHAASISTDKLDSIIRTLPENLAQRSNHLRQQASDDAKKHGFAKDLSGVPTEKIFTDALVSGSMTPEEFVVLMEALLGAKPCPDTSSPDGQCKILGADRVKLRYVEKEVSTGGSTDKTPSSIRDIMLVIEPDKPVLLRGTEVPKYLQGDSITNRVVMPLHKFVAQCLNERKIGSTKKPYKLLESLAHHCFVGNTPSAMQTALNTFRSFDDAAHAGEGEARFFQLVKDFETRHERRLTGEGSGGLKLRPHSSALASNHRNRRILRRNLGEVSVVQAAQDIAAESPTSTVWVVGHDQDLVTYAQHGLIADKDANRSNTETGEQKTPFKEQFIAAGQTPGATLHPNVARQHSRFAMPLMQPEKAKNETIRLVPSSDFLTMLSPAASIEKLSHSNLRQSDAFRASFGLA